MDQKTFEMIWGDGHEFTMQVTERLLRAIARWEQFIPHWYVDGVWREGPKKGRPKYSCMFGHQEGGDNPPFEYNPNDTFTLEQGWATLRLDAESKAKWLRKKIGVPVTQTMFEALHSLVYNVGEGTLAKGRVLGFLNDGKYTAVCAGIFDHRFMAGVEKNGLIARRGTEIGVYMTKLSKGESYANS